jgi:CDP-glycerol glycerophosphotransferase (TagB/SpsB family)
MQSANKKLSIAIYVCNQDKLVNKEFVGNFAAEKNIQIFAIASNSEIVKDLNACGLSMDVLDVCAEDKNEFYRQSLNYAKGEYVCFVFDDELYDKSFYKNFCGFEKEFKNYDVIVGSEIAKRNHYQAEMIIKSDDVIELQNKLKVLPKTLRGVILRTSVALNTYNPNCGVVGTELDTLFLSQVFSKSAEYAGCKNIVYLCDEEDPAPHDYYILNNQFLRYICERGEKCHVEEQRFIINELAKYLIRINNSEHIDDNFFENNDSINEFARNLLSYVSFDEIANFKSIAEPYKAYLTQLKIAENPNQEFIATKRGLECNGACMFPFKKKVRFDILEIRDNVLTIEGLDYLNVFGEGWHAELRASDGEVFQASYSRWALNDRRGFDGSVVYHGRKAQFKVHLYRKLGSLQLFASDGEQSFKITPQYGKHGKFSKKLNYQYYLRDSFIIKRRRKRLLVRDNSFKNRLISRLGMFKYMISEKKFKYEFIRILAVIAGAFKRKPLWIIRDNEDRAKDSGAEMFKYYSSWQNNDYAKAVFVLDKTSEDYKKMKEYGKIIQPDSLKYKIYHLIADKIIDTRGGIIPNYIFGDDDCIYFRDMCDWDYIWLIHGVITRNESTWTHRLYLNAKLYATCNQRECESVQDEANGYGYDASAVRITGLPRHDALNANKKRKILFLPTWRQHLAGDIRPGSSERAYVENFKENDFFAFYNGLINDKRLIEAMKKYGYTGDFYLHPSFIKQCDDFDGNEVISIGKKAANTNELIGECSLLLTDYSSAQFEGVYLGTPIIYTQYDMNEFSELHTGKEGYFDYFRDGFGPVCQTIDETVDAIIETLERNCEMVEPYASRAHEFFKYKDHNNSARVFNEILNLDHEFSRADKHVEKEDNYACLLSGDSILKVRPWEKRNSLVSTAADAYAYMSNYKFKDGKFNICVMFKRQYYQGIKDEVVKLVIGDKSYDVSILNNEQSGRYFVTRLETSIDLEKEVFTKKTSTIFLSVASDKYTYIMNVKFDKNPRKEWRPETKKSIFSKPYIVREGTTTVYLHQTAANNLNITMRDYSKTDLPSEQRRINLAYRLSKLPFFAKARNSIILFEKFTVKYEESASVLYEYMIDNNCDNVFYIMDKGSKYYKNVGEKYQKNIVQKHSFKHYLLFFASKKFIATESMNHAVELNIANRHVSEKTQHQFYDYVFLQHGIMYMYCLHNQNNFVRGKGVSKTAKVVVSSKKEAKHFIDYGEYREQDLILSGLPKYDRAVLHDGADKILVIPTSRDFEYNVMRTNPQKSTYYKFAKNIIESVPDNLKDKIIFVSHPLIKDQMRATDLAKFMPDNFIYNELLKDTRLLITDCSSISFDAFYRGANVVFCWEDKDMCLEELGYSLMLNEDNVFADVSNSFDDLTELIEKNYFGQQSEENIKKYREIVMFHDGENTKRCFNYLKENHYLDNGCSVDINDVKVEGITRKGYFGKPIFHDGIELSHNNKVLIYGRDYSIHYRGNRKVNPRAALTIRGKGKYRGSIKKNFKVCKPISKCEAFGMRWDSEKNSVDFSNFVVRDGRLNLLAEKDYAINDIEKLEGSDIYKVHIKGKGLHNGNLYCYVQAASDGIC